MRAGLYLLVCAHVSLGTSSQTAGASVPPVPTEDPNNEASLPTHTPTAMDGSSTDSTGWIHTEGILHTGGFTPVAMTTHTSSPSPSAAGSVLSSLPPAGLPTDRSQTDHRVPLTLTAFTSQTSHSEPGVSSVSSPLHTSPDPITPLAPAAAELPHQVAPFEFNVGDEDHKNSQHPRSPLDPLLAALLSVFIVITAIVFVILFLKFRQKNNDPEFHRLQDLPMDDLMEDTPLSRFSY